MDKPRHSWTVADAKAQFSAVIDQALAKGPQTITRRGRETAIVVSFAEWSQRSRRSGSLAEFLAVSPLRGSGLTPSRRGKVRKIRV